MRKWEVELRLGYINRHLINIIIALLMNLRPR